MSKDFIATQEALYDRAVFPGMNEKLKCQFESRLRGWLRIPFQIRKDLRIWNFNSVSRSMLKSVSYHFKTPTCFGFDFRLSKMHFGFEWTFRLTNMLNDLWWDTLEHRHKAARLVQMKLIQMGDSATQKTLTPLAADRSRRSRTGNSQRLHQTHCRTDAYRHSFLPWTCRDWNKLPDSIINRTSIDNFKSAVLDYICHTSPWPRIPLPWLYMDFLVCRHVSTKKNKKHQQTTTTTVDKVIPIFPAKTSTQKKPEPKESRRSIIANLYGQEVVVMHHLIKTYLFKGWQLHAFSP